METTVRRRFDQEIETLRWRLQEMGTTADAMLGGAVEALQTQNLEVAETVINQDNIIDDLDRDIEAEALLLLATQQPVVGSDLRFVSATLKAITDLERIGDHTVNVAKTAQRMAHEEIRYEAGLVDFPRFVAIARRMLAGAIQAMVHHDTALAYEIIDMDDQADVLYREAQRDLRKAMQEPHDGDPTRPVRASYLLFVAHYMERICDHCTNIAERFIFAETGEVVVPVRGGAAIR